jgi:hypothetical protein
LGLNWPLVEDFADFLNFRVDLDGLGVYRFSINGIFLGLEDIWSDLERLVCWNY